VGHVRSQMEGAGVTRGRDQANSPGRAARGLIEHSVDVPSDAPEPGYCGCLLRVKLGPAAMSAPMSGLPESSRRADIGRLSESAIPVIAAHH
jgi:hypothetical protein